MNDINESIRLPVSESDISMKYLIFQINGQHYGISISDVIEIVQIKPVTKLPDLPFYAKGIINLRGLIVPLIDANLRFGKPEREYTDRTCIIIVDIDGVHVGLIVDAVEEVMDIENDLISSLPSFTSDVSTHYVTGIGKLDKYMVLLLNSSLLFTDADMSILEKAAM